MHLTGKEYQMLELLSLRKGTSPMKEMFLNHLYGGMDEPPPAASIISKPCGAAAT
jgi:DNA-binding response OmpR family regulator